MITVSMPDWLFWCIAIPAAAAVILRLVFWLDSANSEWNHRAAEKERRKLMEKRAREAEVRG